VYVWPWAVSYADSKQTGSPEVLTGSIDPSNTVFDKSLVTLTDNDWVTFFGKNDLDATCTIDYGTGRVVGACGYRVLDTNGPVHPAGSSTLGLSASGATRWSGILSTLEPAEDPHAIVTETVRVTDPTPQVVDPAAPLALAFGEAVRAIDAVIRPTLSVTLDDTVRTFDRLYGASRGALALGLQEQIRTADPVTALIWLVAGPETVHVGDTLSLRRLTQTEASSATVEIAGVDQTLLVDLYSIWIDDQFNEVANTITFEYWGAAIARDASVVVWDRDGSLSFAGRVIERSIDHHRLGEGRQVWTVRATDVTYDAAGILITARFQSVSATAIALWITAHAAFLSAGGIDSGLPIIDDIQFTMTPLPDALRQLADRFGGDTYIGYDNVVRLFVADTAPRAPTLEPGYLDWRDFHYDTNDEQAINRVYCGGLVASVTTDVPAALDQRIPLDDASMFPDDGGLALITGKALIRYAETRLGGAGSLVGPGANPSTAPSGVATAGAGLTAGVRGYAYTFKTTLGESLPSPIVWVTTGTIPDPNTGGWITADTRFWTTYYAIGDTVQVGFAWSADFDGVITTAVIPGASLVVPESVYPGKAAAMYYNGIVEVTALARYLQVFIRVNGGPWARNTVNNCSGLSPGTTVQLGPALVGNNSPLGNPPATPNAALGAVALTNVAIGPDPTTQRVLYRTAVGQTDLKLLATISDNTTTTPPTDTTPDASLGALAPTGDTSGLALATGQLNAGSTTAAVANTAPFEADGGWAEVGSQCIRYTGKTAAQLTGIPADGVGAILATVLYGATIRACPMLIGCQREDGGYQDGDTWSPALAGGDSVALVAVAEDGPDITARNLVRAAWVSDARLSYLGALERATAELVLYVTGQESGRYTTGHPQIRSGQRVPIAMLAEWGLAGEWMIRRVQTYFDPAYRLAQHDVTFGSATAKDLYRILHAIQKAIAP